LKNPSDSPTTLTWQAAGGAAAPQAVALVMHGLNVNPTCMGPLEQVLVSSGAEVLRCALMGHGPNFPPAPGLDADAARLDAMRRVTYELWRDEVSAAQRIAAARAELLGVPLVLAAYSLGAPIACAAALTTQGVHFDKLLLFAPALRIHRRSRVLQPLARRPQLVIPSATPRAYRANQGTTVAAYNALYKAQDQCEQGLGERLNVPALVFVDLQDELVSAEGIQRLIRERNLSNWQVHLVHKSPSAAIRYHHLLIDPQSVGAQTWAEMAAQMRLFL
jgi:pimeloyl-ACP methyl ester carboxylesterase